MWDYLFEPNDSTLMSVSCFTTVCLALKPRPYLACLIEECHLGFQFKVNSYFNVQQQNKNYFLSFSISDN